MKKKYPGDDTLTILLILLACAALVLLIAYACYRKAFYAHNDKHPLSEEECIPPGEIYEPYRELMLGWVREVRQFPYESVSIQSFDGLTLTGKYYEYAPGAPMEMPVRMMVTSMPNFFTQKSVHARQSRCSRMPKVIT